MSPSGNTKINSIIPEEVADNEAKYGDDSEPQATAEITFW